LTSEADVAQALNGINIIFHLAAGMRGSPADIFWDSVICSNRMLSVIKASRSLRIVLVSSFGVYGVAQSPRRSLVDENTPLEPFPEQRDPYSYGKWRQESQFREHQQRLGFELVVVRPGVVYGPGGGRLSTRVGLNLAGLFLHCGHGNILPLTYVDNCAEAIVIAGSHPAAAGESYNVHDDDLPTARSYLKQYKLYVRRIPSFPLPYFAIIGLSHLIKKYHRFSKGQLPSILTPHKSASLWKGNRFSNDKLKSLGWRPLVATQEGLRRTFQSFAEEDRLNEARR
jgi:nucleoside-diphosphate-sugar epimerase